MVNIIFMLFKRRKSIYNKERGKIDMEIDGLKRK